jgi:hypothetical protein
MLPSLGLVCKFEVLTEYSGTLLNFPPCSTFHLYLLHNRTSYLLSNPSLSGLEGIAWVPSNKMLFLRPSDIKRLSPPSPPDVFSFPSTFLLYILPASLSLRLQRVNSLTACHKSLKTVMLIHWIAVLVSDILCFAQWLNLHGTCFYARRDLNIADILPCMHGE